MAGTQQYIALVDTGQLEFGTSNMMQAKMAFTGTGMSAGKKFENIRLVGTLMKFETGLVVTRRSGIKTVADLRAKRVPNGFRGAPLFHILIEGKLANGGLGWDDVQKVNVVAMAQHRNMFKEGTVDTAVAIPSAAIARELDASIPGGILFLSFSPDGEHTPKTQEILPGTYYSRVEPGPAFIGVDEPINLIAYDFMIWAGKHVPDAVVYEVTKALYQNEKELKESSALWQSFSKESMAKDQGWDYHPGAVRFYQEAGIYKR
jgi:TRAP transporter TAXI family solute receptor